MFVQSNNFIKRHHLQKGSVSPISVYGQEKTLQTVNLAKMNLAINGLRGEIKQGDSYAEDLFDSHNNFDFVMANPPFNVKEVNEDTVKKDKRFTEYGLPSSKSTGKKGGVVNIPNGNYLWISLFATSLNAKGRAALVMANSASDAGHSEYDIRKTLIQKGLIAAMLTLPGNMFSTVTLPATLWFFDKSGYVAEFETGKDNIKVLFVDARNVYHQIDRAHREFTDEQIQNLAAIHHLQKENRQFFIELVHRHYTNAFEGVPVLKKYLAQAAQTLRNQIKGLAEWTDALSHATEGTEVIALNEYEVLKKLYLDAAPDTSPVEESLEKALAHFAAYQAAFDARRPDEANAAQHGLLKKCEGLMHEYHHAKRGLERTYRDYEKVHKWAENNLRTKDDSRWKALAKPKEVRWLLDRLNEWSNIHKNNSYEDCESGPLYFMKMAEWLQQRFPQATYENVTGLCKLAYIAEIEEQDYSLNPGRYVGVVIEEDGLTEEEFEDMIEEQHASFLKLNDLAKKLETLISNNLSQLKKEYAGLDGV